MIVHSRAFIALIRLAQVSIVWLAKEVGMSAKEMIRTLKEQQPFNYEQSKCLIEMFGADAMIPVIDWRATHACREM